MKPSRLSVALALVATIGAGAWLWNSSSRKRTARVENYSAEVSAAHTSPKANPTPIAAPVLPVGATATRDALRRDPNVVGAADVTPPARGNSDVEVFVNLRDINFGLKKPSGTQRVADRGSAPAPEYKDISVTVAGPNGYRKELVYPASGEGTLSIVNEDGSSLPDGLYKYEAYARTELVGHSKTNSKAAKVDGNGREAGDPRVEERNTRLPQEVRSGTFRIQDGQIVQPEIE